MTPKNIFETHFRIHKDLGIDLDGVLSIECDNYSMLGQSIPVWEELGYAVVISKTDITKTEPRYDFKIVRVEFLIKLTNLGIMLLEMEEL